MSSMSKAHIEHMCGVPGLNVGAEPRGNGTIVPSKMGGIVEHLCELLSTDVMRMNCKISGASITSRSILPDAGRTVLTGGGKFFIVSLYPCGAHC